MKKKQKENNRCTILPSQDLSRPSNSLTHDTAATTSTINKTNKRQPLKEVTNQGDWINGIPNPQCKRKSARWIGLENFKSNVKPKRVKKSSCNDIRQNTTIVTDNPPVIINLVQHQQQHYKDISLDVNFQQAPETDSKSEEEDEEVSHQVKKSPLKQKRRTKKSKDIVYLDEGDPDQRCKFCHALMWFSESAKKDRKKNKAYVFSLCCLQGKVVLPVCKEPPPVLNQLFFNKNTDESKKFYENIRQYNNMFSFTSMGGKINHALNNGRGPYTFALSGVNYHTIGNLVPPEGEMPIFSQLYIHDTDNEVNNRIKAVSQHQKNNTISPTIVEKIKKELDETNPFVKQFRSAGDKLNTCENTQLKMRLISSRNHDGRTYNIPTASEVAALIVGDIDADFQVRDVILEAFDGSRQRINELHASYLPLQYPLLFPYGEDGYRDDITHREETLSKTKKKKTRLLWVRTHQKDLRADLYVGISNAVGHGETQASATGKRIVLPSSFTGGPRYMMGNYQDAMAICRTIGYPDLFITFTCNSQWPEVTRLCKKMNIDPNDCPQILSRVFYMKLKTLMKVLKKGRIFGKVRAEIYTIEFQKRGLPHAHILLFLDNASKLNDPAAIDRVISAEIPDQETDPQLHQIVKKFMIHGPCGQAFKDAACMKNKKKCGKHFPKRFNAETTIDEEGYPTYRRRDDGKTIEVRGVDLDNTFVVPYNPLLLKMFNAHINVEKCNQSRAIKYLFKYISKGGDRVVVGLCDNNEASNQAIVDEVQQYLNGRYVSSCEATWRAFGFPIQHRYPSVERLNFHLPNHQFIVYPSNQDMSDLLDNPRVAESQFLSWMKINESDTEARKLTYSEFPNKYVFQKDKREWKKRAKGFAVGRMHHVSISSGELYYLRILLTHVRSPKSYDDIKTVDDIVHRSFKDACFARGLLDDDSEYISALKEAAVWASGHQLRKLFVSMMISGSLHRPNVVWQSTSTLLSEDMLYIPRDDKTLSGLDIILILKYLPHVTIQITQAQKEQEALIEINRLLQLNGKSLHDFSEMPIPGNLESFDISNHLILQELNYDKKALAAESIILQQSLNSGQKVAYSAILEASRSNRGGFFFVSGFGGTGKTFLWNALAATIRFIGGIVLTVASSGIAATLLPGGRTAHSRFAIPLNVDEVSTCFINQNSPLANLLKQTSLIIWDEAPMVQRLCIEAFNRSIQDIMHSNRPFGGKCIVMGGDFRQILPVIPKARRAEVVNACINSSLLWRHCKIFHLHENMRLNSSNDLATKEKIAKFSQWLLNIGDGKLGTPSDAGYEVEIPSELILRSVANPIHAISYWTYDNLIDNLSSNIYFNDRAILAPTLEMVAHINEYMCSLLPGEAVEFLSCDSVCPSSIGNEDVDNLYSTEFLNTIKASGMAPHRLLLKVGAPIMLLRNIDQEGGLCNGTRLRITKIGKMVIEAITLNGSKPNQRVLIHRMDMNPSETRLPFKMQRRQFPIILSFAMTINKSQGQSLKRVGLYLSKPVFTHGQLYVALSRVRSMEGLKLVLGHQLEDQRNTTTNVVYHEVFWNVVEK